jgi:hypothetical protein
MCAEDDDDQNYRYNPRSITGRDGFLSKAFGLALSSYLAVGGICGAYAEVVGYDNGNKLGVDFSRGFVYGAKQFTYFGYEAVKGAYEVGEAAYDATFD